MSEGAPFNMVGSEDPIGLYGEPLYLNQQRPFLTGLKGASMRKTFLGVMLGLALLCSASVGAQVPAIKNPGAISFTSVDHDNVAVTGYEVDFVNSAGAVVQTVTVAKSATTKLTNGDIRVNLNVQPVAFGNYKFVVRTMATATASNNSVPSDTWERAPGSPSKPINQ